MLRAVAAAQGQPREARRAPWTGKAMGREGNQAMCVLQSRLSLLAPGWRWQCPGVPALSQSAKGGWEDQQCWHCSCDGHRMVCNCSNRCVIILGEIPKPGSQALPLPLETGRGIV